MSQKIWAVLVHLTRNMWDFDYSKDFLPFDDGMWDYILEESAKTGVNTIVLDVGDGIEYASHPEISVKGAWTRKRVREELKRCKELGITLIPKLNFATSHDHWLGEYSRMVSTGIYYRVCNDLIKEVYELFDHPKYIHLGMDEENAQNAGLEQLVIYRQGELYWHDMRFLMDCVHDTGAKPWIWSCSLFEHPEEFKKHIDPKECVISPWYYNAIREDHWTPITSRQEYIDYYSAERYAHLGLKYVEEEPFFANFRKLALPLMKEGYLYVPCASVYNRCDWNTPDLVEYFKENAPDEQIYGYMTAPWAATLPTETSKLFYEESFRFLKEAKEKFYGADE